MNVAAPMSLRGRTWTIVALVAAALVAGCGSDDEPAATVVQTQTVTVDSDPLANLPGPTLDEGDREYLRSLDALASEFEAALPTLDADEIGGVRDRITSAVANAEEDVDSLGDKLLSAATIAAESFNNDDPASLVEAAPRLLEVQAGIAAQLNAP